MATAGLLFLAIVVLLAITGMPIAFGIGIISFVAIAVVFGLGGALNIMAINYFGFWVLPDWLALPCFILMAECIIGAEYDNDLFDVSYKWVGRIKGSLAMVAIVVGALFGSLCGSSVAGAVTVGVLTLPKMLEHGYDKRMAAGAVAAAGGLAHMIPPSVMAVIYACLAETSVGQQLMAGLLPGIVLSITFLIVNYFYCRVKPPTKEMSEKFSWKEKLISLRRTAPALILGVSLILSIYLGVTTATEAAALGASISLVLLIIRKGLDFRRMGQILQRTVQTTCFLMLITYSGVLFGFLLSFTGIPQQFVRIVTGTDISPLMLLIIIQFLYLFLGCFFEGASMLILTLPVLLPIMKQMGWDPIWFGVLFLLNLEIGLITPPVGIVLYAVKGIAPKEVTLNDVLVGSVPYFGAKIATLMILMIFPQIALWLPRLMRPG